MRLLIMLIASFTLFGCDQDTKTAESVQEPAGLDGPEAVRYDPELDIYYVSNFVGESSGDANAYVSTMSPTGKVLIARFMSGTEQYPFHGGRGMYIDGDGLWVVDAGGVHRFDRRSGEHLAFVDFSNFNLGFLNDIVEGHDGAFYVTDTGTSSLYRIENGVAALVTTVPMKPNGITAHPESGDLLLAPWSDSDEVIAWSIAEQRLTSVGKLNGGGNFDGIEVVGDTIITASQMDRSLHFMVDGVDRKAIELPGEPADIGIDTKRNNIAVPFVALDRVEIIPLQSELD